MNAKMGGVRGHHLYGLRGQFLKSVRSPVGQIGAGLSRIESLRPLVHPRVVYFLYC